LEDVGRLVSTKKLVILRVYVNLPKGNCFGRNMEKPNIRGFSRQLSI
jgi:hypothetical protein